MSKQKSKTSLAAKFKLGDKVRVMQGVKDTDYPDMPLGGWAGTIVEAHDDGMYTVRWNKETLASIHPVFKKRCERDGLECDRYWIGGNDLEPDRGGSLDIEPPTKIASNPLSPKDQDDRIRMILGLTSNDPLPEVDDETLEAYHKHLSKYLAFPFTAEHGAEDGHPQRVQVIGLGDPSGGPIIDPIHGILCEVRLDSRVVTVPLGDLECPTDKLNRRLVGDYCYWIHNWS